MNIFLIGYRCAGKTSVGRALAEALGMAFVDADDRLVRIEGRTVAQMVSEKGWDYFRRREKEVLAAICGSDAQVVATGGGVVLEPENVAAMKGCGRVVWLRAEPQTVRARLMADPCSGEQRPALTSSGPVDEIEAALRERTPLYGAAMDFAIDTDGRSVAEIRDAIVKRLMEMTI